MKEKIEKEKAVAERNKLNDSITVRERIIAWRTKAPYEQFTTLKVKTTCQFSGFKFGEEAKETKANK